MVAVLMVTIKWWQFLWWQLNGDSSGAVKPAASRMPILALASAALVLLPAITHSGPLIAPKPMFWSKLFWCWQLDQKSPGFVGIGWPLLWSILNQTQSGEPLIRSNPMTAWSSVGSNWMVTTRSEFILVKIGLTTVMFNLELIKTKHPWSFQS